MSQQQTILALLGRGRGMLRKHLADFSEADMLARVAPAANHAAYQLGHLLRTSWPTVAAFTPDAQATMPPKTDGDSKAPPTSDDPSAFATRDQLLDGYDAMVDALIAGVGSAAEADFDKPSPEHFHNFAPTLGQLAMMVPFHTSMHVGQVQSIRRKLGKPVLF